jgi:hypothetical protein
MVREHSPILEEVVGGKAEVPRSEVNATNSSSGEDIDPGMTLVIRTKRVGPWIHMNLHEAMILGPQP